MAAKTSEWRPGPTVCRCCLSEGCYKDISTEYFWMGKREVYSEMLSDTFDLSISYSKSGGPNSASRLICEPCIGRLRDAAEFKRQVQECEKTFVQCLDPVTALADMQVTLELEKEVKVEMVKEEKMRLSDDDDYGAHDYGDDDDDYDDLDDQPLTKLASKIPKKEDVDVLDLLDNAKVTEKRKSSTKVKGQPSKKSKCKQTAGSSKQQKPEPKKKKDPVIDEADGQNDNTIEQLKTQLLGDFDDSPVNVHCLQDKTEEELTKLAERRGRGPICRENSMKLIAYSTLLVFQWNKSWYSCICCKEQFPYMSSLREHITEHDMKAIEGRIIKMQNTLLKAEISDLRCKICETNLSDLDELQQHLVNVHSVKVGDAHLLVPYKLETEGMRCQICKESFTNFRFLRLHVNKHYKNHICDVCGNSFANLLFLNLHKTRSHKRIRCDICDMDFSTRPEKRHHDAREHNVKIEKKQRFPCQYCDERFFQENLKFEHLVEKHGVTRPEHRCLLCPKVYITRSLLNNHVKSVHKKEKKHECDVCHNFFYTKSDLLRHSVTHTGEKKFSCSLCNSTFATKDSLRRHMKRNACGT
ncbi:zinc finger protein 99 isoform X11 [Bicyclus anynana]|uniref:Zinc finger protein 99 isoform X11 n=1 Tax=Bicyclus anynana TaxID=110368 RepID=A0ABM3M233_BICAN|nr:zinc finger protein 99 isoform X11 [Bicyclus anynana]